MKNAVLDSFAIISFLRNEAGADIVRDYFEKSLEDKKRLFICSVNWAEVGCKVIRKRNLSAWKQVQTRLKDFPVEIVETDPVLTEQAAEFKALHKISLADAYAAALTKTMNAELVTGDAEFKQLEEVLKGIVWLRQ
ncbi:MAG: type II toxin-antitoxin system VapC family toxin [Pontiellaceae bacterium]|nr:type II toxin-antitoxin system VapC family toxin [Pontiellaceae bacterium]